PTLPCWTLPCPAPPSLQRADGPSAARPHPSRRLDGGGAAVVLARTEPRRGGHGRQRPLGEPAGPAAHRGAPGGGGRPARRRRRSAAGRRAAPLGLRLL